MKKCLKITLLSIANERFVNDMQKKGTQLAIEGTLQYSAADQTLRIIACGLKEQVDMFIDFVHEQISKSGTIELHIEPFVKARDYRNAFRIIE